MHTQLAGSLRSLQGLEVMAVLSVVLQWLRIKEQNGGLVLRESVAGGCGESLVSAGEGGVFSSPERQSLAI